MAVSTTVKDLTSGAYVSIGTAPLLVQARPGSDILIAPAASLPAVGDPGLQLSPGDPPLAITGSGAVYARSVSATGKLVVAVLA